MWSSFVVFFCIAVAFCDRVSREDEKSHHIPDRSVYNISYAASDGTERHETGLLRQKGDTSFLVVKGIYSWLTARGTWQVTYEADENGFRSETVLLPPRLRAPILNIRIQTNGIASLVGGGLG
ncbi:unnamed protein product [Acanthoscelides obtectus]|uniref:Uncharacterized protein n=1 Tax=Acanthoscelides obtectus TaxID=200917 RepID=A0A9P0KVA4_ACAOB|nr:unnamed protein product [Acanthoscelides obtectus]CAH1988022.1 unnamed protein product [Acanthoscelides obtectus]CAK1677667.1 hypothetical protein AOBTE_LOCUS31473 [Acanthoscelides obtectus]CAK1677737.1 hypothetical protein AOBTE_LOCUS31524 [Acanthoscelides obtectus]